MKLDHAIEQPLRNPRFDLRAIDVSIALRIGQRREMLLRSLAVDGPIVRRGRETHLAVERRIFLLGQRADIGVGGANGGAARITPRMAERSPTSAII